MDSPSTEERKMKFIYGFALAVITAVCFDLSHTVMMTDNPLNLGGILPVAFFTLAPLAFFALGRVYPEETRIIRNGNIYYRRR